MKMQQRKLWRNSSKKICKSYCRQGDWQSDFKKYNKRGMAGDGCASFFVTGKSRKQQFFWGFRHQSAKGGWKKPWIAWHFRQNAVLRFLTGMSGRWWNDLSVNKNGMEFHRIEQDAFLSDDAWHHHRCGVSDRTGVNRRRSDSEMTKMPLRSSTSQLLWKRWRAWRILWRGKPPENIRSTHCVILVDQTGKTLYNKITKGFVVK